MELLWLNRLRCLTWLSKKERMGSAERIADAAILAGDVLIERFIGSAGGGHIKEQQLIRTPFTLPFYLFHSNVLPLFIYLSGPSKGAWAEYELATPAFPFYCVLLSWHTVHRYRWPAASAAALIISPYNLFWGQLTSRFSADIWSHVPTIMSSAVESH